MVLLCYYVALCRVFDICFWFSLSPNPNPYPFYDNCNSTTTDTIRHPTSNIQCNATKLLAVGRYQPGKIPNTPQLHASLAIKCPYHWWDVSFLKIAWLDHSRNLSRFISRSGAWWWHHFICSNQFHSNFKDFIRAVNRNGKWRRTDADGKSKSYGDYQFQRPSCATC